MDQRNNPDRAGRDDGGPRAEYDALVWQARAQIDLGAMIARYLTENPPPSLTPHAHLFRRWAQDLQGAGEAHLEALVVEARRAA